MKTLGIILARKHSSRLKDKHLIKVGGKPLIQYTFEYAKASPVLDDIVCSTDSDEIAHLAKLSGIETIKRPSRLARADSHEIEALEYTLRRYRHRCKFVPEVTVTLFGNVPYRGTTIEAGLKLFYKKKAEPLFTASRVLKDHPEWMFQNNGNNGMVFRKKSLNFRCQDLPDYYIVTDSFRISKTQTLLNRTPRKSLYSDFGKRVFFIEEEKGSTVDVDDIRDLKYFRFLLSNKKKKTKFKHGGKTEVRHFYEEKHIR